MELPKEKSKVEQFNPSLMVIYGRPKTGKSTVMANIDDNLILDLEDGYRSLSVFKIVARDVRTLFDAAKAIKDEIAATGKKPYKFITIDNATRLEEYCLPYANHLYRTTTPTAKNWGFLRDPKNPLEILKDSNGNPVLDPNADVRMLPKGAGWTYVRTAVKKILDEFKSLCETLILVAHVKEKLISIDGTEMNEMDIELSGKLSDIICGEADCVGYLYRKGRDTFLTFKGGSDILREARPIHLRGKEFKVISSDDDNNITVDLSQIFI